MRFLHTDTKHAIRNSPLRPVYLWVANRYRALKRLFAYPSTARVGVVDYDTYWDEKLGASMGQLSAWRLKRAQVFAALVEPGAAVLDLGVGDGALLRYLVEQRGVVGYGLDVSPKAVEFCRAQGLNVDLADINQPIADSWVQEFARIIRPGGALILTTNSRRLIDYAGRLREKGLFNHPWEEKVARMAFVDAKDAHDQYERGEFLYARTGTESGAFDPGLYGHAIISPRYVRSHWSTHFDMIDFVDDSNRSQQAMVVMVRKWSNPPGGHGPN